MIRLLFSLLVFPALLAAPPAFIREGKGPGILLIHGFGGNKEVWRATAAALAKDHTVVRVDLPGSGGTPVPVVKAGAVDLEAIAKDLVALVHREKLEPCLIVGHSMGGPVAALAVLQDPHAFKGLVLVDSFLGFIPAGAFEPILAALSTNPEPTLAAFFGPMATGAAQTQRLAHEALKVPVPVLQGYLRAMTQDYMGARHTKLALPVVQFAAGPEMTDPAKREAMMGQAGFKNLPDFRIVFFPQAKHWIMWDEPEGFCKALKGFENELQKP